MPTIAELLITAKKLFACQKQKNMEKSFPSYLWRESLLVRWTLVLTTILNKRWRSTRSFIWTRNN